MTPAFGFSVGDFIGAIELCAKVSKALKDTAVGASADYQHVILELHGLQNALSRLASLEPTESNINHVNAIRGMALACQLPIQEFLSNIEKYEKTMGPFASGSSSLRGTGHKAKWAVFVAEEVKKIRALVSAKTISINLLLSMHTSETVSTLESRGKAQHHELLKSIEEHRAKFQGLSRKVEEVKEEVIQTRQSTAANIKNLSSNMQSKLDGISGNTAELAQNMSALSVEMASTQNSVLSLRDTGSQILTFLRKFPADLRTLLQTIIRTNMQMYYVLLKIDSKVSASPSLLNQSNIRFEDALGVVRELPHEWFKHWEPFEGLLQAQFKDTPGKDKVLQGQYYISYAKRPGVFISKEDWTRSIQPGSEIVMSVLMTEVLWQQSSCPRASCSGKPSFEINKPSIVICPLCGLKYFPLPSTFQQLPKRLTASEHDRIAQIQVEEDVELFGHRDMPPDVQLDNTEMGTDLYQDASEMKPPNINLDIDEHTNDIKMDYELDNSPSDQDIGIAAPANGEEQKFPSPLLSWLEQTLSPENPSMIQSQLREKQVRQEQARVQEMKDIELFRNVHVVPSQHLSEEPAPSKPTISVEDDLELAARIYYRNIVDRYPAIPNYLARRLAEANLARAQRLSLTKSVITPDKVPDTLKTHAGSPMDIVYNVREEVGQSQFKEHTRGRKRRWDEDPSKMFVCDICNRRFRRQEDLKRHHLSLHSHEKPFDCLECGRKFWRSDNLDQHARTHRIGDTLTDKFQDDDLPSEHLDPGSNEKFHWIDDFEKQSSDHPASKSPVNGLYLGVHSILNPEASQTTPNSSSMNNSLPNILSAVWDPFTPYPAASATYSSKLYAAQSVDASSVLPASPPLRPLPWNTSQTYGSPPSQKRVRGGSNPTNYWTNTPNPARPGSRSSSMNSSLHGYNVFDPQEQIMNVWASRPGSVHSLGSGIALSSPALPPPPVAIPSLHPFECDICGVAIRVKRKRDWKKHVLRDLQPYICTFEDCKSPEITFSKRRDFIRHEMQVHQLTESFYQCVLPRCQAKLKDPGSVHRHQESTHGIHFGAMKHALNPAGAIVRTVNSTGRSFNLTSAECDCCCAIPGLQKNINCWNAYERPCPRCKDLGLVCGKEKAQLSTMHSFDSSKVQFPCFACPFCQESIAPGNRPRSHHLGQHMEEISFSVVTKPYEEWQFYDNTSSGESERWAAAPAPQSMMGQSTSKAALSTEEKHICNICNKLFMRSSSLRIHMYSHRGEKPFHCDVEGCGKKFAVRSNLRRHLRGHQRKVSSVIKPENSSQGNDPTTAIEGNMFLSRRRNELEVGY